ncbi:MAG: CvfD/Ygs/GSP13 family RNA-binding post-transcriptional regulator [Solobacterium sp.]|jgi:predicted RNA-binding protein with RPS1 domain|nr:CvfD/Ygs/GSP13 family RNA-binding post-transcriptional regulator [Solobacterium sp.]MCH4205570.1 CvfD/Ygs/GSP13 family RNA-binding post-transcriptional regulator [Solobacterium sp.]MCH4227095.1 CvfD/Ygs/GSP13 family RNA-binding post-transcriptional regulator [Solobacterium sp.]MCH4282333.1 CvfD/Ygs/GSP13 family RNA-binding post-transcriptional regulator [Solobacterium sp.]
MSYQIGQIVEGKITGIQPYGAFVSLDKHTSGLIHISEISDGFIRDINSFVKVGDTVKAKIIDFDNTTNQARLSIKALNHSRVRNRRKQTPLIKASLPSMKIGFQSIASHMDQWIADAKGEILHDNEI